jgi:tetratricopeptide (TPR) repeat protein
MPEATIGSDDFYERLGVSRAATVPEIQAAYRRLVRQFTPEKAPEEFKRIRQAYETLQSTQSRREYDTQPSPAVRVLLNSALGAFGAERYEEAERYLKQVLIQEPESIVARNHLGLAFLYQNKPSEALAQYERLVRSKEPAAYVFGNLGHTYRRLARNPDAIAAFRRAIELAEDDPSIHVLALADLHLEEKHFEKAKVLLEGAIRRDGKVDIQDLSYFMKLLEVSIHERDLPGLTQLLTRVFPLPSDHDQTLFTAWKVGSLARALIAPSAFDFAVPLADGAARLVPEDQDYAALAAVCRSMAAKQFDSTIAFVASHASFGAGGWLVSLRSEVEEQCRRGKTLADVKPIDHPPTLRTINTVGFRLFGRREFDPHSDSYVASYCFVVLFIPLFPIACYRVIQRSSSSWVFLGRVPFSVREKRHWLFFAVAVFAIWLYQSPGGSRSATPPNPYVNSGAAVNGGGGANIYTPKQPHSVRDNSSLRTWIDGERIRIGTIESQLQLKVTQLNSQEAELSQLAAQLRTMQADAESGVYVDENDFDALRLRHNSLVDAYDSDLHEYRRVRETYQSDLNALNLAIDRYNAH